MGCWRIPTRPTIRTRLRNRIRAARLFRRPWRWAKERESTESRFLRAVTLGYDVGPRIGVALGGEEYRFRSHRDSHSISGTFGSAAAAACVAGLNAQQMRWVLDYASQQASGIAAWQRDPDHIEKGFVFAGGAARDGVTSALLVQAGLDRRR